MYPFFALEHKTVTAISVTDLVKLHEQQHPSRMTSPSAAIQELKGLYASHRYKECIQRASDLKSEFGNHVHPLHQASFLFYKALSNDTMARNMPFRMGNKIFPAIDTAMNLYETAISILEPATDKSSQQRLTTGPTALTPPSSLPVTTVSPSLDTHGNPFTDSMISIPSLVPNAPPPPSPKTPRRRFQRSTSSSRMRAATPSSVYSDQPENPTIHSYMSSPTKTPRTPTKSRRGSLTPTPKAGHKWATIFSQKRPSPVAEEPSPRTLRRETTERAKEGANEARKEKFDREVQAFVGMLKDHIKSAERFRKGVAERQEAAQWVGVKMSNSPS